jgi:hypothetical protein
MKKLLPEPLDFIVHYPLLHYVGSMFTMPPRNVAGYCVTPKTTSVIVTPNKGGAAVFSDNVAYVEGAPNADLLDPGSSDENSFSVSGPYQKNVFRKYKLGRGEDSVLLLDHPRLYLNFHGMQGANVTIGKVYEELAKAPQSILPGWQGGEAYNWVALTEKIELAGEGVYASTLQQIFLAGMPSSIVDFICSWATHSGQTLRGIIPFPLAVAGWAREKYAGESLYHLVVPSCNAICVFTFVDGKCSHYFAPKNDNYAAGEVAGAVEDVNSTVTEATKDTPVYVWPTGGTDMEKLMTGLRQSGIRTATAISLSGETGLPLAPTASLLEWALRQCVPSFGKIAGGISTFDLPREGVEVKA